MATLQDSLEYTPVELGFGTSGLRGLVTDMTDLECYINTAGFIRFLEATQKLQLGTDIYLAGDLRDSTPRILRAVVAAIRDKGYTPVHFGFIPTPAIAYHALQNDVPSIMVTGSHTPADRNGIKFYKVGGEVLKADEQAIKDAVAVERATIMHVAFRESAFDDQGQLKRSIALPAINNQAEAVYIQRHLNLFSPTLLTGKKVVVYQHSAVGRDMLGEVLQGLGAEVITVGRSDEFVPIDTENVTLDDRIYFALLAKENPGVFAIVSTDGDSDRPFVVDERGVFHRGDELGAVVAKWLAADYAAILVSSNDAVDAYLQDSAIGFVHTKIGSPHIIVAMEEAIAAGKSRVVGWEANGGFLLGTDMEVDGTLLKRLPTRDAFLPILIALAVAQQRSVSVSEIFTELPARFTQAGLIDNYPVETSRAIVQRFSEDTQENRDMLSRYFSTELGFGTIKKLNSLDGVRIFFSNGDIAHLRPSGNAPQMRIYSVADSQERADAIVQLGIAADGILEQLKRGI